MSAAQRVSSVDDLPPGRVVGVGRYAVGNRNGEYFAVTRRCRHLGADLAGGKIDEDGCLVCPGITRPTTCAPGAWSGDHKGSSRRCPDSGLPIDC